ncbi:MAG: 8-amino-7-oxononanoate synthase [Nitrosomonadaceae bacterium]|jgi:8-amino-7-oxononanoate synthase|nr:8-amino-7-oxononanoate synthase [Nitrosomonadaceae bacterium]
MYSESTRRLHSRKSNGLYRDRLTLEGSQGVNISMAGQDYLSFCSNDYLGLANHPELIEAACEGAHQYGVGACASHLTIGHHTSHHKLEEMLANFTGFPRALLFSSGYMANAGVVSSLVGRGDEIYSDKLNHASLNDAAMLSHAKWIRYPHLDLAILENRLSVSQAKCKLVITDAVFSMDGDIAPVAELLVLCEKYNAWLLLDDAHGFGVLGNEGRGIVSHYALSSPRIIYMGTLGKAAGVSGAFIAGQEVVIETLIQYARSYIYTTAMPPLLSYALLKSLALIKGEGWRRKKLMQLTEHLKKDLKLLRWNLLPSDTPIQPIIIGGNREVMQVRNALQDKGILVSAIRPPTVPKNSARLRISLSAAHSIKDVERLAIALRELE